MRQIFDIFLFLEGGEHLKIFKQHHRFKNRSYSISNTKTSNNKIIFLKQTNRYHNSKSYRVKVKNIVNENIQGEIKWIPKRFQENLFVNKIISVNSNQYQKPKIKHHYNHRTLFDIQTKEFPNKTQTHYDGENIYEYNINGLNEHNIIKKL